MASNQFVILAIAAIVLPTVALATQYIVGDDKGWTISFDYEQWATEKVFMVGDSLVFKYNPSLHNVIKVNGTEFKDCMASPANQVLNSGNDTIVLATPGNKWYICGIPTHCAGFGQKLAITVVSDLAPAPAPPVPAPAPAPPVPAPSSSPPKSAAFGFVMAAIVAAAMIVVY